MSVEVGIVANYTRNRNETTWNMDIEDTTFYMWSVIFKGSFLTSEPMACMVDGILTIMPGIAVVLAIYETFIIKKYKLKK